MQILLFGWCYCLFLSWFLAQCHMSFVICLGALNISVIIQLSFYICCASHHPNSRLLYNGSVWCLLFSIPFIFFNLALSLTSFSFLFSVVFLDLPLWLNHFFTVLISIACLRSLSVVCLFSSFVFFPISFWPVLINPCFILFHSVFLYLLLLMFMFKAAAAIHKFYLFIYSFAFCI